jgi:flagellar basal-body rod protein FlgF
MDRLAFTASHAITELTYQRQALANEIANLTTTGFKRSFDASLISVMAKGEGFDSRIEPQLVPGDFIDLKAGPLMVTGRELDIALTGKTVMGVMAPNGELAFTRRGDVHLNNEGTLITGAGHVLMSADNNPITIPPGFKVRFGEDGNVFATDPTQPGVPQEVPIAQLMLRDASEVKLERREDGLFKVLGQASGTDFATGPEPVGLTSQTLEGSNVNPMAALVRLIDQSRTFEQQVRMIKEAKSNDENASSMIRLQT